MSSKRNRREQLRRKMCVSKVPHDTQTGAVKAMINYRKNFPYAVISSYRCKFCGRWHFGHTPFVKRRL